MINVALFCKRIFIVVLFINAINFLVLQFVSSAAGEAKLFELKQAVNLMILSTHQDDGVISAGVLAVQNSKLNGQTSVIYLTRPEDERYAKIRREEAIQAWSLLPLAKAELFFMDFFSKKPWEKEQIADAEKKLRTHLETISPSHIVIPLAERGHYEHDLYGVIALKVLKDFPGIQVLMASEYNPVFMAEKVPGKTFWFLLRLLPFVPYNDINVGINPEVQTKVKANDEELELKKQMLLKFVSQKAVIPLEQFGYTDLFDQTEVGQLKLISLMGKYFSIWALLTLLFYILLFFSAGTCFVNSRYRNTVVIVLVVGSIGVILSVLFHPDFFKEELVIVSVFITGMIFSLLYQFIVKRLS